MPLLESGQKEYPKGITLIRGEQCCAAQRVTVWEKGRRGQPVKRSVYVYENEGKHPVSRADPNGAKIRASSRCF